MLPCVKEIVSVPPSLASRYKPNVAPAKGCVAANAEKSVEIGLFANDKTTAEQTITLDGVADANGEYEAWKYSFTVPKYNDQLSSLHHL